MQKLASTLANRYENWCVTNFAGTNEKKIAAIAAKIRKANRRTVQFRRRIVFRDRPKSSGSIRDTTQMKNMDWIRHYIYEYNNY